MILRSAVAKYWRGLAIIKCITVPLLMAGTGPGHDELR
jgi:hypothetical protein